MNDLQKLTTDKTNIDGIQMVVLVHMLQWNITVVHMEGFWSTDGNMATDIVIAYTGPPQKLFFPTQVGNLFICSIFFGRGWDYSGHMLMAHFHSAIRRNNLLNYLKEILIYIFNGI